MEPVPLLAKLLAALTRRRKAIKHKVLSFEHRLETETAESYRLQRLNVDARLLENRPTQIRLSVWEDGEMWLRVCRLAPASQGGWAFMDSFYGSISHVESKEVIELFESTLTASGEEAHSADLSRRLREIWQEARPQQDV